MTAFGMPAVGCKRNLPMGFLDTHFATEVLDRFQKKTIREYRYQRKTYRSVVILLGVSSFAPGTNMLYPLPKIMVLLSRMNEKITFHGGWKKL